MAVSYTQVAQKKISASYQGILRISPDENGDRGFKTDGDTLETVYDSNGESSCFKLSPAAASFEAVRTSSLPVLQITGNSNSPALQVTSATNSAALQVTGKSKFSSGETTDTNLEVVDETIKINGAKLPNGKPNEKEIWLGNSNHNFDFVNLDEYIENYINKRLVPSGTIVAFAGSVAPAGWLLCDGASYNTNEKNALFMAIGYTYSENQSGNTFNVPDLRNKFIRGASINRPLGNKEESAAPNITGTFPSVGRGLFGFDGVISGSFSHDRNVKAVTLYNYNGGFDAVFSFDANNGTNESAKQKNVYKNNVDEVRPTNVALNYIIKD